MKQQTADVLVRPALKPLTGPDNVRLVAIDPGPNECGVFVGNPYRVVPAKLGQFVVRPTWEVLAWLREVQLNGDFVVVERIESYGMPVGRDVFDTVHVTGRVCEIVQSNGGRYVEWPRREVKLDLCEDSRAKDTNVRQALLNMFGNGQRTVAVGSKKKPGPLYGIKSHAWEALAIAISFAMQYRAKIVSAARCDAP